MWKVSWMFSLYGAFGDSLIQVQIGNVGNYDIILVLIVCFDVVAFLIGYY